MAHVPKVDQISSVPTAAGCGKEPEVELKDCLDRELVRRAQLEDKVAFEELIRRHQSRVFAVATKILKRREDAEEIAQQAFCKAYFSLKRFDGRAAFSTWLYSITVNECWDLLRKKKARPLLYEADLSEEQAHQILGSEADVSSGGDISDRLASRQRVEKLLSKLGERDRVMLVLKEVEGFSIEEIAAMMKLNDNTVKVRLFRARQKIVRESQGQS